MDIIDLLFLPELKQIYASRKTYCILLLVLKLRANLMNPDGVICQLIILLLFTKCLLAKRTVLAAARLLRSLLSTISCQSGRQARIFCPHSKILHQATEAELLQIISAIV